MALTKAQLVDLNANELIIDLDADTSITADTDDQIDIKIAGADDFRFTANTFTALSGSSIVVPASGLTIASTAVTSTAAELNLLDGVSGLVQADLTKLAAIDATATELNLIDGDATVGTTAVADGDGIVTNDGGTMRQTTVQTFATYFASEITAMSNLVTTGALDSGSITSGFGNIDNGASNITSGGLLKLDVDTDADDVSADSATGRLTLGANEDLNLYHGGTHSYIVNDTGDLKIDTAGDLTFDAAGNDFKFLANGTEILNITNSSSDVVIKPIADTKDIIFQQRDGTEVMRVEDGAHVSFAAAAVNPEATLSDGANVAWNTLTSPVAKVTLGGNRNLSAGSGGVTGQFVSLLVIQDGTGSRTLTFNAVYEFAGDVAPTLTTTANKGDLFVFRYNGAKYLEVGRNLALTLS